jgi:hypothetical protein
MHIPDDYDQFWSDFDQAKFYRCERCHKSLAADGDDYCVGCRAQIDHEESLEETMPSIPVLQPIIERPVELNAQLWAEWKKIAERLP